VAPLEQPVLAEVLGLDPAWDQAQVQVRDQAWALIQAMDLARLEAQVLAVQRAVVDEVALAEQRALQAAVEHQALAHREVAADLLAVAVVLRAAAVAAAECKLGDDLSVSGLVFRSQTTVYRDHRVLVYFRRFIFRARMPG
jgi:hypothetical protein